MTRGSESGGRHRTPALGLRLFVLALMAVGLMIADHREQHLHTIRDGLSVLLYPLQGLVDLPFAAWHWAGTHLATRGELIAELEQLRRERLDLRLRLQRLDALEAENERLRAMLDSSARVSERVLVAEILSVDLDPYRHRFLVNKGKQHDVFQGQALLDADGVMGQVVRVHPLTAEIILISDADHAMPVVVNRTGLRTIAVGTGDTGRLALPFLPNSADIEDGDLLITSGLGGAFPDGYPVARVSRVQRQPGSAFAEIRARPTAALDRAREVLLVWSAPEGSEPPPAGAPTQPAEEPSTDDGEDLRAAEGRR